MFCTEVQQHWLGQALEVPFGLSRPDLPAHPKESVDRRFSPAFREPWLSPRRSVSEESPSHRQAKKNPANHCPCEEPARKRGSVNSRKQRADRAAKGDHCAPTQQYTTRGCQKSSGERRPFKFKLAHRERGTQRPENESVKQAEILERKDPPPDAKRSREPRQVPPSSREAAQNGRREAALRRQLGRHTKRLHAQ